MGDSLQKGAFSSPGDQVAFELERSTYIICHERAFQA